MERVLRTMLMVILPLGGIIILALTWLRPLPEFERVLNTFAGAASILLPLLGPILLKNLLDNEDTEQAAIKAEAEDEKYPEIKD